MGVSPGMYRHVKGDKYKVHFVAHHSESLEPMVVYEALYEMKDDVGPYFVRPLTMFVETVEREGKIVPRFERLEE